MRHVDVLERHFGNHRLDVSGLRIEVDASQRNWVSLDESEVVVGFPCRVRRRQHDV